ncbi:Tyrosine kinase receptor Cad96Ca-like 2 [Homarus americanus]|uniref:Tyrosine kinase receptor Cad96Ca-like 2 n=1 Tax=Homarus americanus TaxID=6706 RepID=A0A8J5JNL1_HOMAM|nr:Tyrosine kinase receptor Cad96Ca-like 2 [Homarus americanus]
MSHVCVGSRGLRRPAVGGGGELSTNTLAEVDHPTPPDYGSILKGINGDFGIRSEVVEAAGKEPEYRGSETLVVPLYIPEGAVPINLARIARSGSPQPVVELLNMKVSPSADSVLIRRIGPVSGQRAPPPPRRGSWRPPQRTRISRLPPIRRSDVAGRQPIPRPTPPTSLLAEFGQRLPAPNAAPLVAVRRISSSQTLPHSNNDGLDNNTSKRAKKNELSKDTQFPDEFHTTHRPEDDDEDGGLDTSLAPHTSSTTTKRAPTTLHGGVLFPRPVESILKTSKTETSTTTSTTTTPTTTTTRSPSPTLRVLPAWLTRSKPSPTKSPVNLTTTTPRTPAIEKVTLFTRLRTVTTNRPLTTTTETTATPEPTTSGRFTATTKSTSTVSITKRPLRVTQRPASTTADRTTSAVTTSATTTRPPIIARRPVLAPERYSPVRMMPSVSEILKDSAALGLENSKYAEDEEDETSLETTPSSSSMTESPSVDDMLKEVTPESSVADEESFKASTSRTVKERERKLPIIRFSGADDKEDDKQETTTKVIDYKPTVSGLRKFTGRARLTPSTSDFKLSPERQNRPLGHRRRRPLRTRITLPPIIYTRDFFTEPEETFTFRSTTQNQKITITTTPSPLTTTLPTTTVTTDKTPEQIVLESLTEIMKDATNNNKSKDKVSSITTNLEALNKQLAERGIHIIHAEVDGVKIKLDNRTITRPIIQPVATTFRPVTAFNVSSISEFSTTERPSTSISSPSVIDRVIPTQDEVVTDSKVDKQILTSVKSSFSYQTSKPTEAEEETDSDNEVQSTTNDSSYTTTKPVDIRKFTDRPGWGESPRLSLSSSLLPYVEEAEEDPARNKTQSDGYSKTPLVEESSPPVRTTTTRGDPDTEGEQDGSVTSKRIFATSTVPASVTTRTRSTTVPITTHRPATRPFLHSPRGRPRPGGFTGEETIDHTSSSLDGNDTGTKETDFENSTEKNTSQVLHVPRVPATIHPTSHHRPTLLPTHPDEGPIRTFGGGASIADVGQDRALPATTTEDATTTQSPTTDSIITVRKIPARVSTLRPIIDLITFDQGSSSTTAEHIESDEFDDSPSSLSSYTAVYIIGVIGIIPAAGLAAFLAKKFLKKTQKALPESEERGEGFTPSTHHSRKPSHSTTLDVDGSSVEAKNPHPKYTPWEFPRSKLRLVSILGEGNFGVVWKAEARELCACEGAPGGPTVLVAVKGVKEGAGVKERQDLLKELAIMQHIGQHPNVVTLLGCCTQQEPHFVIMEYIMFGKLLTFLRDHRTRHNYYNFSSDTEALTSKDLTRFACQVATGCDYLQSRGIIHRDLASRNILVDHNKGALPIRWMAPESLYMSIFTHKSDVWSFGIMCWEIVTLGSTPYPGMTAREVMRRVREGYRLDRPDHCHPELYRIVTKCWHQDLNKRPSFSDVKVELAQLLDHGQQGYIDLENFPEGSYFSMHENNDEKL